jgi:predicted DNA-binding protein (MmcQ/YjbR family)
MDSRELRGHCLALPGASEEFPFNDEVYPAIAPGYHLNKRHWNTITLDGSLPDQMVADLLGDSYDLVVAPLPKARRPPGRP